MRLHPLLSTSCRPLFAIVVLLLLPTCARAQSSKVQRHAQKLKGLERDAMVLAQGHSRDGFINVDFARKVQKALERIRARHPLTAKLHARGYELRSVFVVLTRRAQKALRPPSRKARWRTGIAALDKLNKRYGAIRFSALSPPLYRVRFRLPMDIVALRRRYGALPQVRETAANRLVGDGHDIKLETGAQWRFTFKHGSGDCPSGCIRNTYYYFSYDTKSGAIKQHKKKK